MTSIWSSPTDARDAARASGLGRAHFRQIARNGLGDQLNGYFQSMSWFKDRLYVGSTRANMILMHAAWSNADRGHNLEVWPVPVPENHHDLDLRAQVWQYNPVNRLWKKVLSSPMVKGRDGFKVPMGVAFRVMAPFQGKSDREPALYVPTWATSLWPHTILLRSVNGEDWETVGQPGLGLPDPQPRCLRAFLPFKGRLFVSPAMGQDPGKPQTAGQALVFCTDDPVNGKWVPASTHGFGDSNNISIYELGVFKNRLYAGTLNPVEGFQVWRTDAEGEPPYEWKQVISHGAFRGKLNEGAMTLCEFQDHLYVGGAIQFGGYDPDFQVGPAPPEVIRIREDDTWDLVCGEARLTPDGLKVPISGMGPAFGNFFACYLWRMCVHDGWLYSGDAVWSPFIRFSDNSKWPATMKFFIERYEREMGGFNFWRTRDGVNWLPITRDGFGNDLSLGLRTMSSTPHGLFVGVGNPFGPEVAVRRAAGWTHRFNPEGGAQVWLGSYDVLDESFEPEESGLTPEILGTSNVEKLIDGFYGGSGFRHRGYWGQGVRSARESCENLVEELLAFVPEKRGIVADVGCGTGATTDYLKRHFPSEDLVGVPGDRKLAKECRVHAPGVLFVPSKLPKLKLGDRSADILLCAEGLVDVPDKETFLREAWRVLRPGGQVVIADMLFAPDEESSLIPWRRPSPPKSPEEYALLAEGIGFKDVRALAAPPELLVKFHEEVARHFWTKVLLDEIDEETFDAVKSALPGGQRPLEYYVLVSAVKVA